MNLESDETVIPLKNKKGTIWAYVTVKFKLTVNDKWIEDKDLLEAIETQKQNSKKRK